MSHPTLPISHIFNLAFSALGSSPHDSTAALALSFAAHSTLQIALSALHGLVISLLLLGVLQLVLRVPRSRPRLIATLSPPALLGVGGYAFLLESAVRAALSTHADASAPPAPFWPPSHRYMTDEHMSSSTSEMKNG